MRSVLVASLFTTLVTAAAIPEPRALATPVQGWNETQTTLIHPNGDTSLCLEAVDKVAAAAVVVAKCDCTKLQGWKAEKFGDNGVRFVLDPTIIEGNAAPTIKQQQCIDLGGVSTTMNSPGYHPYNGRPAVLHPCRQGSHNWPDNQNRYGTDFVADNSRFFVTYNNTGVQQEFCLDRDASNPTNVQALECNDSTNQLWTIGASF